MSWTQTFQSANIPNLSADEVRKKRHLSRQSSLKILSESAEALLWSRALLARPFYDPVGKAEQGGGPGRFPR